MKIISSIDHSIFIGNDSLKKLHSFIDKDNSSCIFLVDEHTKELCFPLIKKELQLPYYTLLSIKSGEKHKTIQTATLLWQALSELEANRNTLLILVGGGVITDLGGFVASSFKRGIRHINIPTTLLCQVDASVGGKVGVDLNHLKNQIGLFSTPSATITYPDFIKTLPQKELKSGFAEIIKHALIADKNYWKRIQKVSFKNPSSLEELICTSIQIKNNIVCKDPKEKNIRKALNFGHTFSHAFETFSLKHDKIPLAHGHALAMGMICESFLSYKHKDLAKESFEGILNYIRKLYPYYKVDKKKADAFLAILLHDKKKNKATYNFSLLSSIGQAHIDQELTLQQVKEALQFYINLS